MKKQANDNGFLFENEVKEIQEVVERAPDLDLTFSRVFSPRLLSNPESTVATYTVSDDDTGSAELLRGLADYPKIRISGSEVDNPVYKAGLSFDLELSEIELSRRWGRPLDTEYVERTKRGVDEKINSFIYVGDSKFGVNGVYSLSGVTSYAGTDLDTASLNLADEFTRAVQAIPVRYRQRPYTMVMADKEFKKFQTIGNTTTNETWISIAKRAHPNVDVVVEATLDAGTALGAGGTVGQGVALLIPKDKSLCRMPVGYLSQLLVKPSATAEFDEQVSAKVKSRIAAVEAPFPTALVKVTGWD